MANVDLQNRAPSVTVLPDFRLQVERKYSVLNPISKDPALFLAEVEEPLGTTDAEYTDCYLIKQVLVGELGPFRDPNAEPPVLTRTYLELDGLNETQDGNPGVEFDQYRRKSVIIEFVQLAAGTATYQIVGTTAAPSPFTACILKTEERTNNGTLVNIKRTYIDSGQLSDNEELRFGGNLLVRTLTYLNQVPPTPSGYTLITESTEFVEGLPVYRYGFAKAAGSGSGTDGIISQDVEYKISPDQGTSGVTVTTIKKITPLSVTTNPITGPFGSELIDVSYVDEDGYRLWTARFASGTGLIDNDIDIRNQGKLYVYTRTAINAVPDTPNATIGGTVSLVKDEWRNGTDATAGTIVYTRQWQEGNGVISTKVDGREDGSLVYTVVELDASQITPAYPGAGTAYLVTLDQDARDGYYINTATYIKPPATVTLKKVVDFKMPGLAQFTTGPDELILIPPSTITIEANQEVSYDLTQNTDVPYSVLYGAYLRESYIRTNNNGVGEGRQDSLGYILAVADGVSGTNDYYNGVLCDSYTATLNSSSPTARPTGSTVIDKDNSIYLVATNGVVVYRRVKVSYSFP